MPRFEAILAFSSLRFPTSDVGGTCAFQPSGTAPYSLPIHPVSPPDPHRRSSANFAEERRCGSGGDTACIGSGAGTVLHNGPRVCRWNGQTLTPASPRFRNTPVLLDLL